MRDPAAILAHMSPGFDATFRAVTSATEDLRCDELVDRDPIPFWGKGVVTLLGDAAHPVLPHTGQGAAQAIVDAVTLGKTLGGDADVERALRSYERERQRQDGDPAGARTPNGDASCGRRIRLRATSANGGAVRSDQAAGEGLRQDQSPRRHRCHQVKREAFPGLGVERARPYDTLIDWRVRIAHDVATDSRQLVVSLYTAAHADTLRMGSCASRVRG